MTQRNGCSGAMTLRCDGVDVQPVDIGLTKMMRNVPMCAVCREVAARFGMLDLRSGRRGRRKGDR
jgi:hypothetical protein